MHDRAVVAVAGPATPVVPGVKLSASSSSVGVCDDLKLDASKSTGSGGRSMVYAWSVAAVSSHDMENVTAVTDQAGSGAVDITLPSATMPQGSEFEVTLEVTNFLGETSSSKVTIAKLGVAAPTMKVQGDNPLTTATHSSILTLAVTAELPTLTCVDFSLASATTLATSPMESSRGRRKTRACLCYPLGDLPHPPSTPSVPLEP